MIFFTQLLTGYQLQKGKPSNAMNAEDQTQFQLPQDLLKNEVTPFHKISEAHSDSIESICAHPSHQSFASGSHDHQIKIWDLEKLTSSNTLSSHSEGVWSLDYSKDGKMLVSGSPDTTVVIWDDKQNVPVQKMFGHKDKVYCAKFNEENKLIASIGEGAELLIWDVANTSTPIKSLDLKAFVGYDIAWSNHGEYLFITTRGSKVIALNSKTFEIMSQDTIGHKPDSKMEGVSANWQTLPGRVFCSSGIGHIAWYMFQDGKLNKEIEFSAHAGGCRNVNLHPHQKYLLSSGKDGSVRLWDCNSEGHPQIISNLVSHHDNVTSPVFVGDDYIVTGSWDQSIGIWKFADVKNPI